MSRRNVIPECAICESRLIWCEDCWACLRCGNEWDADHGAEYVDPDRQPEWEPVYAGTGRRAVVYWRLRWVDDRWRSGYLGGIAREDIHGMTAFRDADTVSWRAIGYPLHRAPSSLHNVKLGEFAGLHSGRTAAERAVLAHWRTTMELVAA